MDEATKLSRGLRNRTPVSTTLRNDLLMQLKQISEDTDAPITKLLDRSVDMFIKSYHANQRL